MLIVNPWHWLEPDGSIPTQNSKLRARLLAVLRVVEYGSPLEQGASCDSLIKCRKRRGGHLCLGLLRVAKTEDDSLSATCNECGTDHMLISNWQRTRWARNQLRRHIE